MKFPWLSTQIFPDSVVALSAISDVYSLLVKDVALPCKSCLPDMLRLPGCNGTTVVVGCVGSIGAQDCRAY